MTLESKRCSFMMSKGTTVRSEAWINGSSSDFLEAGFSWPPRSYSCSFCHREFRSAQALGGHMNVHRRDRARLRVQSPPPIINSTTFLNVLTTTNPNPNPSLLSSSAPSSPNSSSKSSTFTLLSVPPAAMSTYSATAAASAIKDEKRQRVDDDSSFGGGGYSKVVKTTGSETNAGLDLEIGLLGGPAASHEQDLDLELRLGCF